MSKRRELLVCSCTPRMLAEARRCDACVADDAYFEVLTFEQVGSLPDPYGGTTIYECDRCSALVTASKKNQHAKWHERVGG